MAVQRRCRRYSGRIYAHNRIGGNIYSKIVFCRFKIDDRTININFIIKYDNVVVNGSTYSYKLFKIEFGHPIQSASRYSRPPGLQRKKSTYCSRIYDYLHYSTCDSRVCVPLLYFTRLLSTSDWLYKYSNF
uniref:Uncharacterized protein n=1 Tax=Romanomermis culicivorax TaxID=13658 RepID=A0A915L4Q3_ROMCU